MTKAEGGADAHGYAPWREVADRIWNSDRKRFKNLYAWILIMERRYRPEQIADTLMAFEQSRSFDPRRPWYPYLTKALAEQAKRSNSQAFVARHNELKQEEAEWARKLRKKAR